MKAKKIILSILIVLFMSVSLYALLSVVASKFTGGQPRIFGLSFHVVVTDSMSPKLNVGDFIAAKKADKTEIEKGDYIIFVSPDPSLKGMLIVHAVTDIYTEQGEIYFRTSGVKEGALPDEYPVSEIVGKYVFKSVFIGKVAVFFSQIQNLLFIAVIIILASVAVRQVKNIINLKKTNKQG